MYRVSDIVLVDHKKSCKKWVHFKLANKFVDNRNLATWIPQFSYRERTICDIIRYEKKVDKELFNKAIKSCIKDSKKNIGRLMEYAEKMNVKKKVGTIIGMWM